MNPAGLRSLGEPDEVRECLRADLSSSKLAVGGRASSAPGKEGATSGQPCVRPEGLKPLTHQDFRFNINPPLRRTACGSA